MVFEQPGVPAAARVGEVAPFEAVAALGAARLAEAAEVVIAKWARQVLPDGVPVRHIRVRVGGRGCFLVDHVCPRACQSPVRCIASPPATIFASRLGAKAKHGSPSPLRSARYALEFAAVAGFAASVRLLPRPVVLLLARRLGDAAYLLLRHDRRVALANLN